MLRKNCVICNETKLINIFNLINTINIVEINEFNDSEIFDLNFIGCTNCGCVQLSNLFEQDKIYEQPLHYTESNVFKKHDQLLSEFIVNNLIYKNDLLEIGGSYGKLAKLIIEKYKLTDINLNYKILEISKENYPDIENIKYINGNCETFDFSNTNSIIMSHVFEHLYEPRKFIRNIYKHNVKEIIISIPDMDNLTKDKDINNLNIQHTFYINTPFLKYLFNEFNYNLKNIYNYNNNSIFYHFVKNDNILNNEILKDFRNTDLLYTLNIFYKELKNKIKDININNNFYICPSGFYGKIIYYYLNNETKKNVLGFLDSDNFKINKRLSGTKCFIFKKEIIKDYDNITVLIIAEKYKNEIKEELLSYNNKISFIYL